MCICVHTAKRHEDYDPLDVKQWSFYVVRRSALQRLGYSSIGVDAVSHLANGETEWPEVRTAVLDAAQGEDFTATPWWSE